MNILIMAQGHATRLPGKHFQKVRNEVIIVRTLRMVTAFVPSAEVTLVAPSDWPDLGVPRYTQPDIGRGLLDGIWNTEELWRDKATLFILGDVVFSSHALSKALEPPRGLVFYGRTGANRFTGCKYGEIFALGVDADASKMLRQRLIENRTDQAGRLWGLHRRVRTSSKWVEINDWTDDVDTPEDLDAVRKYCDRLTDF